ncbi:DUF2892 domain-containing protein [Cytophagaceae bacterium ABcell3]|nr:DUF2892 domain-containing protein [Cytophagaceae bacterium ABcell3]
MVENVCGKERLIRAIVGLVLLIVGFVVMQALGLIIGLLGAYSLLTSIMSTCPVNHLIGRNSCAVTGQRR